MQRRIIAAAAMAAIAASAVQLPAANIYWKGGAFTELTDTNYTSDGLNTIAPTSADVVHIGLGSTLGHSSATPLSLSKLRVGHNDTTVAGFTGQGTLTISSGASVSLTGGTGNPQNAALWIGNAQNGVLNIDNATVTSNNGVNVGAGSNVSRTGTLNISNGGVLNLTAGILGLGERSGTSGNGVQGILTITGATSAINGGGGFLVAPRNATSSYTQEDGTVSFNGAAEVGPATGGSTGSSFTLQGGTFSVNNNFFVGRGNSINTTVTISGGTLNVNGNSPTNGRFLIGGGDGDALTTGTATGTVINHSAGTLFTFLDVRVGDANEQVTATNVYNLSGTGIINATTGMYVGRQANGTFNQTGGTATLGGALQIGNREAAALATNGLYKISGGALTVNSAGNALNIAPKGTGEFRVVGDDATIDLNGNFVSGNTVDGVGTLAFELEADDGLSLIDVSGTATFAANSGLVLSATNAAPTLAVYNLLTAASIVDNGLAFTGPADWHHQIATGGNGQILQAALPSTWTEAGPGDWNTSGNWSAAGVPSALGAVAIFGNAIGAPSTVSTTGNVTVGTMRFDNANAYTIGGTGSVTWAAPSSAGTALVTTLAGSHAITVPVLMNSNTSVDTAAGSSISINGLSMAAGKRITKVGGGLLSIAGPMTNGANSSLAVDVGTVDLNADLGAGLTTPSERPDLSVGTVDGGPVAVANLGVNQHLNNLAVNPGGTANVLAGGDKTLVVRGLSVATNATLNVNDNDLIVDYPTAGPSPEFELRDKVLLFRNGAGTEGIGFTETAEEDTILAFGEASELAITEFNGITVDGDTVVGKYTYYGDANFDGMVTTDDYVAVDLGLGTGDSWVQGDFDLNGAVTTDDYVVVDLNLGKGTSNPLAYADEQAAMIALHTEMFGQSYLDKLAYASENGWVAASVPEPGAISLVGLGATALLGRRRRR